MTKINKIRFDLKITSSDEKDDFTNTKEPLLAFVLLFIDNVEINAAEYFQYDVVVFSELKMSSIKSGKYLLFTAITGIADDGGWDYVEVIHKDELIEWMFTINFERYIYIFDKKEYISQINYLEYKVDNLEKNVELQPTQIFYPE